ncbi:MAG: dihydrolipoamide acetyltransferase family protein [Pseudomonadota bacterium]
MAELRLPSLGADMDEATLVEWRVKPGDRVERGDIVAAIETSKGVIDIESFDSGIVDALLIEPGVKIPVGTALARIRSDAPGTPAHSTPPAAPAPAPPAPATPPSPAGAAGREGRVRASPAARRHAAELGVDLARLHGTGPHGVITIEDVARAAPPARSTAPPPDMRATIAAAMTRAKREIPHYYLATGVDLHKATLWLAEYNRERPVTGRVLMGLLFVRAVAKALTGFADFNGFYKDGAFVPGPGIHVGVAVALRGGGLVAPALHDADGNTLDAQRPAFQDLVTRARSGHLRASEMADATITVTSLGERGVDTVFPVIHPPQVAIVGFGRVAQKPVVTADGGIAAHPVVQVSLAADHRVSDGHRGGLFLAAIERWLQTPEQL